MIGPKQQTRTAGSDIELDPREAQVRLPNQPRPNTVTLSSRADQRNWSTGLVETMT